MVYPDGRLLTDEMHKHIVWICRADWEVIYKILLPHPFAGFIIFNDFNCASQRDTIAVKRI